MHQGKEQHLFYRTWRQPCCLGMLLRLLRRQRFRKFLVSLFGALQHRRPRHTKTGSLLRSLQGGAYRLHHRQSRGEAKGTGPFIRGKTALKKGEKHSKNRAPSTYQQEDTVDGKFQRPENQHKEDREPKHDMESTRHSAPHCRKDLRLGMQSLSRDEGRPGNRAKRPPINRTWCLAPRTELQRSVVDSDGQRF